MDFQFFQEGAFRIRCILGTKAFPHINDCESNTHHANLNLTRHLLAINIRFIDMNIQKVKQSKSMDRKSTIQGVRGRHLSIIV